MGENSAYCAPTLHGVAADTLRLPLLCLRLALFRFETSH